MSYLWRQKKGSERGKGASALGWKMNAQTLPRQKIKCAHLDVTSPSNWKKSINILLSLTLFPCFAFNFFFFLAISYSFFLSLYLFHVVSLSVSIPVSFFLSLLFFFWSWMPLKATNSGQILSVLLYANSAPNPHHFLPPPSFPSFYLSKSVFSLPPLSTKVGYFIKI